MESSSSANMVAPPAWMRYLTTKQLVDEAKSNIAKAAETIEEHMEANRNWDLTTAHKQLDIAEGILDLVAKRCCGKASEGRALVPFVPTGSCRPEPKSVAPDLGTRRDKPGFKPY